MNESLICSRCGGTLTHYDSIINAYRCDTCNAIVRTEAEKKADIDFERSLGLARQHLQVGNWAEVKRLIKHFSSSRPSEKQLYLILLMAVTKGYSDYLVNDEASRREAFEYWDKLVRLGGVNEKMQDYARRRWRYIYEEKKVIEAKKEISLAISMLISIIAICLFSTDVAIGIFVLTISIASWIITVKYIQKLSKNTGITHAYTKRSDNPFA